MTHYYAWKKPDGTLRSIQRSQMQVRMHGEHDEKMDIVEVTVVESDEGEHWGWYDNKWDHYTMIWQSLVQVEVCFAYGSKAEEDRGRGRVVQLKVEEVNVE